MLSRAGPRASGWAGQACRGEVRARDLGVERIDFERDEATVGGEGAAEPDRAVAAERPELEDAARVGELREYGEEFASTARR